jgi:hypothetical protein
MNLRKLKYRYWYPISVDIEIRLRKLARFIDRLYLKTWKYILGFFIYSFIILGCVSLYRDWTFYINHANLDSPFQALYTSWRTDGSPGQDPPKE